LVCFPVTIALAKKIPKDATRGRQGFTAIKLKQVFPKNLERLRVDKSGDILLRYSGRRWAYRPIPELTFRHEEDAKKLLLSAAQAAFDAGAKMVYFWSVHGRTGGGYSSMRLFTYDLENRYMQYLEETAAAEAAYEQRAHEEGRDFEEWEDWLLGIAILYTN
jgi:hypothetical protein